MKVVKFGGAEERDVVLGLIVSPEVLAKVAPAWKGDMLPSAWANAVGGWCVEYYREYGAAPGKTVESLFAKWQADNPGLKDEAALIDKYLEGFDGRYTRRAKEVNPDYVADAAGRLFNKAAVARLSDALEGDVAAGDIEAAVKRLKGFREVECGTAAAVNLLQDGDAVTTVFTEKREPLVTYPGPLGEFFEDVLERDAFVAILAPEKRGKTFVMMDVAWRAMLERRRVAFFEVGDLSREQTLRRFYTRAARWPMKTPRSPVRWPVKINKDAGEGEPLVEFRELVFPHGLTPEKAREALKDTMEKRVRSKDPYLRVSVHPTNSISVLGVKSILEDWDRDGFRADVVVIDYADILAPVSGAGETRDQINMTWKLLRALSQERHCLVLTATQANAASYSSDLLDMTNFSEDKRKFAHVTAMWALNQSADEREHQLQRWNWLVVRESDFSTRKCVYVAQCLGLAQPAVLSSF